MTKLNPFVLLTAGFLFLTSLSQAQTDVLTQHNDMARTGWNQTESQLTVANVTPTTFGLLTSRTVDDIIYAQPLVVSGVNILGGPAANVVYVATVNNSIYAFDADDATIPVYWSVNLTTGTNRTPRTTDMHPVCNPYNDFYTENNALGYGIFGIVGTPVIDKPTNTMYVVSRDVNPGQIIDNNSPNGFFQYLHAIDIRTGAEKAGSPILITASANGTAPGNVGGIIAFDPRKENQRGGLLLMHGIVYISYAAHCDWPNYHGWVLGYDAATLTQRFAWISTPNDGWGGIWMSGAGIAGDPTANSGIGTIYLATGNSGNGDPSVLENRGEGVVRLNPDGIGAAATKLTIADYFTPFDYSNSNSNDLDFGTQVMLVPGSQLLVTACKDHNLYTFNRNSLGGFHIGSNNSSVGKIFVSASASMHSSLAYFGGTTNQLLYQFSEGSNLKAYPVSNLALGAAISGVANGPTGFSGAYMSTSSNGSDETTGILWITHAEPGCNANQGACPGILRAVQATNVNNEIWNSDMNTPDKVGTFSKMTCPTIANGKVYLPTMSKKLNIYGLLASNPRCVTNVALNKPATDDRPSPSIAARAFDGISGFNNRWFSSTNDNAFLQVDLGASYDICKISIAWEAAAASVFEIQVADIASGPWTTIITFTNSDPINNLLTEFTGQYTGRFVRMQGVTRGPGATTYQIDEMQIFGQLASTCAKPTNPLVSAITQGTATVSWDAVAGAANGYYLKYRPSGVASWVTRPPNSTSQVLGALSCGTDYEVEIQSLCSASDTSAVSSVSFSTDVCSVGCNALPTRFANADIGDVGKAGSSCSTIVGTDTTITMKGSGKDIGGNDDEFQFAFTGIAGDEAFTAHLTGQSNFAANKAGVMMRDSVSNTSRFAYVAITNGAGAQFIYRSQPNGPVTVVQGPLVSPPYYLRLKKIGTVFTASISPSGLAGTWTDIGSKDLGFGTKAISPGFAVTSADNNQLNIATFDNFEESNPLPIALISFTATNINNEYVSIKWTTAMELNNDHFQIERSTDGLHFEKLATVKSAGNSSLKQDYSIADNHPATGINFYRIKQYDIDGKVSVYPVVMVKFGIITDPIVYPNPASTLINVVSGEEIVQAVGLYDLLGKEIQVIKNGSGDAQIKLNLGALAPGLYVLKITTPAKVYQQKIMKD
jgi:F5/8 type C domain/Secretion system C-terminal sorting domain/Fibronectin type III domain